MFEGSLYDIPLGFGLGVFFICIQLLQKMQWLTWLLFTVFGLKVYFHVEKKPPKREHKVTFEISLWLFKLKWRIKWEA